jgi:hypothetical protein
MSSNFGSIAKFKKYLSHKSLIAQELDNGKEITEFLNEYKEQHPNEASIVNEQVDFNVITESMAIRQINADTKEVISIIAKLESQDR